MNWEEHLKNVCEKREELDIYEQRKQKITSNIKKHNYPELSINESHAIRVIANSLYENIKAEAAKSLAMYEELDKAFVKTK
jgi:hypothetical protein